MLFVNLGICADAGEMYIALVITLLVLCLCIYSYIFVRYKSKESAVKVFEEKKDSFDLDVPSVSKTWSAKGNLL